MKTKGIEKRNLGEELGGEAETTRGEESDEKNSTSNGGNVVLREGIDREGVIKGLLEDRVREANPEKTKQQANYQTNLDNIESARDSADKISLLGQMFSRIQGNGIKPNSEQAEYIYELLTYLAKEKVVDFDPDKDDEDYYRSFVMHSGREPFTASDQRQAREELKTFEQIMKEHE
jgi:hypothetical protein